MADEAQSIQSLKVSVGENRWVKLSGPSAFLSAFIIFLLIVVGYLVNFNLKSWGEPFAIHEAFMEANAIVNDHTSKMTLQHNDMLLATRWNTYVLRYCSGNDTSHDAKQRCAQIDLMRPEPEDQARRRYRIPQD